MDLRGLCLEYLDCYCNLIFINFVVVKVNLLVFKLIRGEGSLRLFLLYMGFECRGYFIVDYYLGIGYYLLFVRGGGG